MSDEPEASIPASVPDRAADFLLAEYAALRNEILERTKIQQQLLAMALTAAGVFFGPRGCAESLRGCRE
jgi:hypothetical protein